MNFLRLTISLALCGIVFWEFYKLLKIPDVSIVILGLVLFTFLKEVVTVTFRELN
jgi:hypothetical protein